MSMLKEMFSGYAERIRLENSIQLQKAKLTRPKQVKLEAAQLIKNVNDELKDPELKAVFDSLTIEVPA